MTGVQTCALPISEAGLPQEIINEFVKEEEKAAEGDEKKPEEKKEEKK